MGYTIREITSGWSVIDYPEYFRDLDMAIYNAKEWSKDSKRSMFFIIDDMGNVLTENGTIAEPIDYLVNRK